MAKKILHIIANPNKETSYSRRLAAAFLKEYKQINPEDDIETLDLYDTEMPYFGSVDFQAVMVKQGKNLNSEEQKTMDFKNKLIDQFLSADKIVVTSPFWNFGIPAILKSYIDQIVLMGRTFQFTKEGKPEGLVKNKKICFVMARGADYTQMPQYELQGTYLKTIFGFIGITDQTEIVMQPTHGVENVEEHMSEVIEEAKKTAVKF